jgi:hypothetical protein
VGGRCGLYEKRPPVTINRGLATRRALSHFGTHARAQYIISLWPPPDLVPLLIPHEDLRIIMDSWCSSGPSLPTRGLRPSSQRRSFHVNVRTVSSVVGQKDRIERLAVVLVFHRSIVHRCTALDLLHPTKGM